MRVDEGNASCGAGEVEDRFGASREVGLETPSPALRADDDSPARPAGALSRIRRALGFVGVTMALPFFVWLPLGLLGIVPSMVDVFGEAGLRTPASITVGGLLVAALGFHEL